MGLFASNLFRQLIATALVVSMSMCCCKADSLLGGLSGMVAGNSHEAIASSLGGSGDSCCSSKNDDSPNIPQEQTPAPAKGCEWCCVKSVSLVDVAASGSIELSGFWVELPCGVETTVESQTVAADATFVVVEPPTLLRLHCALII